ncbi:alpha/beta hydrolase [Zobellia amurskyensis]|uniref:Alpha/beta hydrolase n=2 Tax=Zobellia amurskyensis TaxID=248905 RepID=A0A7X2ZT73_9FLAO|nr:alpha/beta hydrolase [Zobellia amurskyensis]
MTSAHIPKLVGRFINLIVRVSPKLGARMALNLFRYPQSGKIKERHAELLKDAEKRTLYLNKRKIQTYRWPGEGKRVLLMHGWQSNSARWAPLLPKLQDKAYDIISMDAPGHGASGGRFFDAYQYALALDEVVKQLKPEVIVAHSVGGLTALYYKSHFESSGIQKIISLGAPDRLIDLTAVFIKLLGFSGQTIKAYNEEFTKFFEKDQDYYNAADFVKKIDIPGAVVHDRNDKLNLYRDGVNIAENWKGASFYTTTRLGHSLQSEEVYEIIVNELEKA